MLLVQHRDEARLAAAGAHVGLALGRERCHEQHRRRCDQPAAELVDACRCPCGWPPPSVSRRTRAAAPAGQRRRGTGRSRSCPDYPSARPAAGQHVPVEDPQEREQARAASSAAQTGTGFGLRGAALRRRLPRARTCSPGRSRRAPSRRSRRPRRPRAALARCGGARTARRCRAAALAAWSRPCRRRPERRRSAARAVATPPSRAPARSSARPPAAAACPSAPSAPGRSPTRASARSTTSRRRCRRGAGGARDMPARATTWRRRHPRRAAPGSRRRWTGRWSRAP